MQRHSAQNLYKDISRKYINALKVEEILLLNVRFNIISYSMRVTYRMNFRYINYLVILLVFWYACLKHVTDAGLQCVKPMSTSTANRA
jgi:hypothetical protein